MRVNSGQNGNGIKIMLNCKKQTPTTPIEFVRRFYHPDLDRPELSFDELGEPWQYRVVVDPIFSDQVDRVYLEMPRDWDKTGLSAACGFAICFMRPGFVVRVYATDRDQAAIVKDAIIGRLLRPNPELKNDVDTQTWIFKFAKGSELSIESSDALSAFGKGQNWAIVDELHCWNKKSQQDLWESLVTKKRTKIVVLTNAGARRDGLCWDVRERFRKLWERDGAAGRVFFFSGADNPRLPSWITDELLARRAEEVPYGVYARLHLCKWGEGGDLFTAEQVDRCVVPDMRHVGGDPDGGGVLGLDFGHVRDWTAGAIVKGVRLAGGGGLNDGRAVRLLNMRVWKGSHKAPVKTNVAKEYAEWGFKNFGLSKVALEAWQMLSVYEELVAKYPGRVEKFDPTGKSVPEISKNLYDLVVAGALLMPPDEAFKRELMGLEAEEVVARDKNKVTFKIVYPRGGGEGHGDRTRAVSIAAWYAMKDYKRPWDEILAGYAGSSGGRGGGGLGERESTDGDEPGLGSDMGAGIDRDEMDKW